MRNKKGRKSTFRVATLRYILACAVMAQLHRCPFCHKVNQR